MSETTQHRNSEALGPKLTNWKNEPSLLELKTDLENTKPSQQAQMQKVTRWNDLLNVTGDSKPKKVANRSQVQPKLVRRQAEWRYSALSEPFLSAPEMFKVAPVTFEDTKAAKQNQKLLNYQFRHRMNRVKFIDQYVRATVDEGTCILRTGWCRQTRKESIDVPVYEHYLIDPETDPEAQAKQEVLEQAIMLKTENPREYNEKAPAEVKAAVDYFLETQQPTYAVQKDTEKQTVEKVIKNLPTVEILNIKNVYIDPSCDGEIDKAMFVIVSFETTKSDLLKEGKKYKNLDKVNWENNGPITSYDHDTKIPGEFNLSGSRKRVVAQEYWGFCDINNDGILVPIVATWIGDTLIRMEESPFPDKKLPFVIVPYMPVKREVYGEPDAELLEDNQKIMGALTRGMIDLLGRSANGQQGFAKGMLDPLNRRRFDDGKDYEFNPNIPISQGLIEHKYPELPNSALNMLGMQNQEAEALTGVKSFSGGISGEAYGDVAAGIKGVLDAAAKREMSILRRLSKGMAEVGEKFSSMNGVFLSEEEVIRITNEEFETILRDELEGQFDFTVDISTAETDNMRAQELGFMLQTMGPNMDFEMTKLLLAEIAELKRMPELAERIRKFAPTPDPVAEKMKELEVLKLEMEIEDMKAEIALKRAKAKEALSKADQNTLDFVEQESGVAHERSMENIQAQAEGNKELEVTRALLAPKKPDESDPDIEAAVGYNALTGAGDSSNFNPNPPLPPVDFAPQPADLGAAPLVP